MKKVVSFILCILMLFPIVCLAEDSIVGVWSCYLVNDSYSCFFAIHFKPDGTGVTFISTSDAGIYYATPFTYSISGGTQASITYENDETGTAHYDGTKILYSQDDILLNLSRETPITSSDVQTTDESEEDYVISGKGTSILEGFSLSNYYTRLIAKCEDDTKITFYTENDSVTLGLYGESQQTYTHMFEQPCTFTSIMIETTGEWEFTFAPLRMASSTSFTGSAAYITDCFYNVTPPKIFTISLTADYRYASVQLRTVYKDGSLGYEECVKWGTSIDGTQQFDVIIKPDKKEVLGYYWEIDCGPDVKWEIYEK